MTRLSLNIPSDLRTQVMALDPSSQGRLAHLLLQGLDTGRDDKWASARADEIAGQAKRGEAEGLEALEPEELVRRTRDRLLRNPSS